MLPDGGVFGGGHFADGVELVLELAVARECAVYVVGIFGQSQDFGHDSFFALEVGEAFSFHTGGVLGFLVADLLEDGFEFVIFGFGRLLCFRGGFSLTESVDLLAEAADVVGGNVRGIFGQDLLGKIEQSLARERSLSSGFIVCHSVVFGHF